MKKEKTTPLRQRMNEDMDIRGLCKKAQKRKSRFYAIPCMKSPRRYRTRPG